MCHWFHGYHMDVAGCGNTRMLRSITRSHIDGFHHIRIGGLMGTTVQVTNLKRFISWLESCEFSYTISSMQGGFVHVKFFVDEERLK